MNMVIKSKIIPLLSESTLFMSLLSECACPVQQAYVTFHREYISCTTNLRHILERVYFARNRLTSLFRESTFRIQQTSVDMTF